MSRPAAPSTPTPRFKSRAGVLLPHPDSGIGSPALEDRTPSPRRTDPPPPHANLLAYRVFLSLKSSLAHSLSCRRAFLCGVSWSRYFLPCRGEEEAGSGPEPGSRLQRGQSGGAPTRTLGEVNNEHDAGRETAAGNHSGQLPGQEQRGADGPLLFMTHWAGAPRKPRGRQGGEWNYRGRFACHQNAATSGIGTWQLRTGMQPALEREGELC